jgi:hypothetical protein
MYMHEAMKEGAGQEIIFQAMQMEVRDQTKNGNFSVIHLLELPKGGKGATVVYCQQCGSR